MSAVIEKKEIRESLTFENKGEKIFAVLHRPNSIALAPLVLFMHGYASSKIGSHRFYVTLAEHLATLGIASLRFDFRGAGDSEGSLSAITLEDLISDGVTLLKGVEHLEGIDSNRIAIFGSSLGGTLAILAQHHCPLAKALCLWAPVASGELWYKDFLVQNPGCPPSALTTYQGIKLHPLFREQFGAMAAYKEAALLTIPILHLHGEDDIQITLAHQEAYKKACQHKKNCHFITYKGIGHFLGLSEVMPEITQQLIHWLTQHL